MKFNMCVATLVMALMSVMSFLEGGIWNIMGVICGLATIVFLYFSFKDDKTQPTKESKR